MESFLPTSAMPFIRADFADEETWKEIKRLVARPNEQGYVANVGYVEDRTLAGLDEAALVKRFPKVYPEEYYHPVVFVADAAAMSPPDYPILVLNLNKRDDAPPFRSVPREIGSLEANLSLSNMDFYEFARGAGADGVFRGF